MAQKYANFNLDGEILARVVLRMHIL
jgi:hypothetical protein